MKELLYNHIADYSTTFFLPLWLLVVSIATSIYRSKSNLKCPAAPLKSTIYPRLIFGNSVALSDC